MKDKNIPRLRFPGFTEPWEQRKLGDIATTFSGGTPKVGNKEFYGGNIPFIRSAEINDDTTELSITQGGLDHSSARMVSKGDILYALYGATSGEVGISKLNGAINQAILAIKPFLGINSIFLVQQLIKEKDSILGTYLQGGQGNLSGEIVKGLTLLFPSLEEQQSIAQLFDQFDRTITLHQRKLDNLQKLKKGLLQKMFPKEGSPFPELRFPEFTEAWEQRQFKDIFTQSKKHGTGFEDVLSVSIHSGVSDRELNSTELGKVIKRGDIKNDYILAEKGDLILNMMRAWQGGVGVTKSLGLISPAYIVAHPTIILDPTFLNELVRTPSIIDKFNNLSYGVTDFRKRLYWDSFEKVTAYFPTLKEQRLIGHFFEDLNETITLHQRKLDDLKKLKKGLLQAMFV